MRIFFAIDGQSTIKINTLWQLLEKRVPREYYEILPLRHDHFHSERRNELRLTEEVALEARKVLKHYPDAAQCIVVYKVERTTKEDPREVFYFDFASVLPRNGIITKKILNPISIPDRVDPKYWVSSPSIQPEMTQRLVECSEIEQIFKDHLLPR